MKIIPYSQEHFFKWDEFLNDCPMTTFLHSRKFLSYHEDRFVDQSLIILDEKNNWLAILPAAVNPSNSSQVISHPGITYGGILHKGNILGKKAIEVLELIINFYKEAPFSSFIYKVVPHIYHTVPSQDDLYALFRLGAKLFRRDLSCTIDLQAPKYISNKAQSKLRNEMRKAEANGLTIDYNQNKKLQQFWLSLEDNLAKKYNKKPTHSFAEICRLKDLFPNEIELITVNKEKEIMAGTLLFKTKSTIHTQYLTITEEGKAFYSLDFLIQHCIAKAQQENYRFFDFGINTENNGVFLNDTLYNSKAKHGGSGIIHDFYQIDLEV